jgi:hypothetical protein
MCEILIEISSFLLIHFNLQFLTAKSRAWDWGLSPGDRGLETKMSWSSAVSSEKTFEAQAVTLRDKTLSSK